MKTGLFFAALPYIHRGAILHSCIFVQFCLLFISRLSQMAEVQSTTLVFTTSAFDNLCFHVCWSVCASALIFLSASDWFAQLFGDLQRLVAKNCYNLQQQTICNRIKAPPLTFDRGDANCFSIRHRGGDFKKMKSITCGHHQEYLIDFV